MAASFLNRRNRTPMSWKRISIRKKKNITREVGGLILIKKGDYNSKYLGSNTHMDHFQVLKSNETDFTIDVFLNLIANTFATNTIWTYHTVKQHYQARKSIILQSIKNIQHVNLYNH